MATANDLQYHHAHMLHEREMLHQPTITLTGFEVPVTGDSAQGLIDAFNEKGYQSFDGMAASLWVLWQYCIVEHIAFEIKGQLGVGFCIEKQDIPL